MSILGHPKADHGSCAVCEGQVIRFLLLVAHEELSKAIEPRVAAFDDPAAGRLAAAFRSGLIADLPHVGSISALPHYGLGWLALVGFVGTQVLRFPTRGLGPTNDNAVQSDIQQFHIMAIGAADDKRERGANTVDQQTAFRTFFSPDPLDWVQRLLARVVLCPWCRRCSAKSKRSLPSRRIPPDQPATGAKRTHRAATAGSACGWRCHCQNYQAAPSTDSPCARHRRSPRRSAAARSVSFRHLPAGDNVVAAAPPVDCARSRAAPPWSRVHQKPPTIALSPWPKFTHAQKKGSILNYG